MKHSFFTLALLSVGFIFSCKNNSATIHSSENSELSEENDLEQPLHQTDKHGKIIDNEEDVITHNIEGNEKWVTKRNLRYGFEIDIPTNWKTIDSSGNGDGFNVIVPNSGASIKVYGENSTNDILTMYLNLCESTQDYTFDSGNTGSVCLNKKDLTFFFAGSNVLISVFISKIEMLDDSEKKHFESMCKSLRFIQKNVELTN
ncbi:MAG: hypothetical protein JXQ87_05810 [Bacteroidia bacterium]